MSFKPESPAPTRRTVLRQSAVLATATMGGAVSFSGSAVAHKCPRTPGYWANHEWPDTIEDPFTIGGVTKPIEEWQEFLVSPPKGDKAAIMATHLIATILNFQFHAPDDPGCVDEPLEEYGGRTIRELKREAEDWLASSSFDSEAKQRSWTVAGVNGEPLKNALDAFNNNQLDLDCSC